MGLSVAVLPAALPSLLHRRAHRVPPHSTSSYLDFGDGAPADCRLDPFLPLTFLQVAKWWFLVELLPTPHTPVFFLLLSPFFFVFMKNSKGTPLHHQHTKTPSPPSSFPVAKQPPPTCHLPP